MKRFILGVLGVSFFSGTTFGFSDTVPSYVQRVADTTKVFTETEKKLSFRGYRFIKREEFLEWILKNENIAVERYADPHISEVFRDIKKPNNYVSAGYALNILSQFEPDGKFLKHKKLRRIEAVKMLFALEGISVLPNSDGDIQKHWHDLPKSAKDRNIIITALQKRILRNKASSDSTFKEVKPYAYLTKEDAIWMLYIVNGLKHDAVSKNTIIVKPHVSSGLKNIQKVETLLQSQYLRKSELKSEKLEDAAISGMVESLGDPYSVYLPPKKADEFKNYINEEPELEKEYAGLGVAIQPATEGGLVITEIFKDSPAEIAHLQVGDVITGVDGESILSLSVSESVKKIKGKVGTSSFLTIKRNGKTLTKSFIREKVFIKNYSTVSSEVKDHILWIKVRSFKSFTARDFQNILREHITPNSGIRGIIIDLRFNPGGLMNVAQEMLGEILPKGSIAVRLYNAKGDEDIYYVDGSANYTKVPLVVFQNKYSASASEIFSAAVKDYERGDIIGTTSFGKGIAQQLFSLPRGFVKITTAEFRSPLQNIIHKVGVKPDYELSDQSDESYFYEAKRRLR